MSHKPLRPGDLDHEQLAETLHLLADRVADSGVASAELDVHVFGDDRPYLEVTIERALYDGDQPLLDLIDFESPDDPTLATTREE